jgi:hypothetical protein
VDYHNLGGSVTRGGGGDGARRRRRRGRGEEEDEDNGVARLSWPINITNNTNSVYICYLHAKRLAIL